VRFCVFREGYM